MTFGRFIGGNLGEGNHGVSNRQPSEVLSMGVWLRKRPRINKSRRCIGLFRASSPELQANLYQRLTAVLLNALAR